MVSVNPALLPVIAPPDLPDVARNAVDVIVSEAGREGVDPTARAAMFADELIGSNRWSLDPENPADLGAAEWAMRQLAQAQAQLAELQAAADDYHRQIDQWFAEASVRARTALAFFGPHLEHYQRRRREITDEPTLKLPSGQVKSSKYQPSIEVDDEAAVIAWAERSGLGAVLVKRDPKLVKSELNRLARPVVVNDADGNVVDAWVEADVDDPEIPPETDAERRRRERDDSRPSRPKRRVVPGVHVKAGHVTVTVVPRKPLAIDTTGADE